jgi:transcriptional regulator of acetoin/glycerol metabolism
MARDSVSLSFPLKTDSFDPAEEIPFPTLDEVRTKAVLTSEREYLHQVMTYVQGDIHKATGLSGLSRARFYGLLKKHGIATSKRSDR